MRQSPRPARSLATTLALITLAAGALGACTPDVRHVTGVVVADGPRRNLVPLPAGMSLQCMTRESVRPRGVTAGTGGDANGNGVVCDERLGASAYDESAPAGPVFTSDDVPLPTADTTAAGEP